MIRQPAVAGTFYPANSGQLGQIIKQFLADAATMAKAPKAIIAPHAGYIYSGSVAAKGYARLKNVTLPITRVILIGPSHNVAFRGIAVSRAENFFTPLGLVPVDLAAIEMLLKFPFVQYIEQAHTHEHSLEVQLPFLQEVLHDFKIVPVVTGDASAEQVADVIKALWGGGETLVIISSDLSHYHNYATAKQLDQLTSQHIEHLRYEQLDRNSVCGLVPISGLLKVAKEKLLSIKTVDLRNSGDTFGNKDRVVGYGTYVID
jgi:MEMO1 family protein